MASNVFGVPITDETLKGLTEYHGNKYLTQKDRAKVAMQMKNAEGKDVNARAFAVNLQGRFGDSVATMCMIYNATGDPITLRKYHTWLGHLTGSPFPVILQNGQWGVFLHGKEWYKENASVAAVVYSANNNQGQEHHWLVSWANRAADHGVNKLYAEIRDTSHYEPSDIWDYVAPYLDDGGLVSYTKENGGLMFVSIGQEKLSAMEAVLTLPEAVM